MQDGAFVGRDQEIAQLFSTLERSIGGSLQVSLIAGEQGDGKTTLVEKFIDESQARQNKLIAAVGTCNQEAQGADYYESFRDIFSHLTGIRARDIESEFRGQREFDLQHMISIAARTLVDVAPELIGLFVPAGALVARATLSGIDQISARQIEFSSDPERSVSKAQVQERTQKFFARIAKEAHPLILVFDDIQWIDSLSLQLLGYLMKSLKDTPIHMILTYRPGELNDGSSISQDINNLLQFVREQYSDLLIDLKKVRSERGMDFVRSFLHQSGCDVEDDFLHAFYNRTDAHPLFATELLRYFRERGLLKQNPMGMWIESDSETDWTAIPLQITRLDSLVEMRIAQLDDELKIVLCLASIQGFEFIAQVIADIMHKTEWEILRALVEILGKQYGLVREINEEHIHDKVITHFRFSNVLYQEHIYSQMGQSERRLLHDKVATSLEELYAQDTNSVVASLARHFQDGQNLSKAVDYLTQLGLQQAQNLQFTESKANLERALSYARNIEYHQGIVDALRL